MENVGGGPKFFFFTKAIRILETQVFKIIKKNGVKIWSKRRA